MTVKVFLWLLFQLSFVSERRQGPLPEEKTLFLSCSERVLVNSSFPHSFGSPSPLRSTTVPTIRRASFMEREYLSKKKLFFFRRWHFPGGYAYFPSPPSIAFSLPPDAPPNGLPPRFFLNFLLPKTSLPVRAMRCFQIFLFLSKEESSLRGKMPSLSRKSFVHRRCDVSRLNIGSGSSFSRGLLLSHPRFLVPNLVDLPARGLPLLKSTLLRIGEWRRKAHSSTPPTSLLLLPPRRVVHLESHFGATASCLENKTAWEGKSFGGDRS